MFRMLVLVALAPLLVSCTLTPDYERPELDVPPAFISDPDTGGSIANLDWWELFQDAQLQYLIRVALEENKAKVGNPLGFEGRSRNDTPDLAGYVRWNKGKAHLGLGYDLFGIKWQGGETGPSDSDLGWGVSLTGRYLVGKKSRNAISGQFTYGDGSAFKVVSLRGAGASAVLDPQGDIDTLKHWQVYAAYNHYWVDTLNSSFVLAHAEVDNVDYQPDSQIKSVSSAHVNLIWFPYKSVSTGVEMMWGERENKDGSTGDATRLQAMIKYKFN